MIIACYGIPIRAIVNTLSKIDYFVIIPYMNDDAFPLPDNFERMESLSNVSDGYAGVPIDIDSGEVLQDVLIESVKRYSPAPEDRKNILFAAAAARIISNTGRFEFPSEREIPDVSDFEFSPNMESYASHLGSKFVQIKEKSYQEILSDIKSLAEPLKDVDNYYSPFFQNGKQIEITDLVRSETQAILNAAAHDDEGRFFVLPKLAQIESPITRARRIPFFIPGNPQANDFDSGNCDKIANTSFAKGEYVWILAQDTGPGVLAASNGKMGWINIDKIKDPYELDDMLELPTSPQTFINNFYRSGTYMHSVWDCSQAIQSSLGLPFMSKYSGDMCDEFKAFFDETEVRKTEDMQQIQNSPGVYIMQILANGVTPKGEPTEKSIHLEVVTVTKNLEFKSRSFSFDSVLKDGKRIYPVGGITRGVEDISAQLKLETGKRFARFYKLAA